MTAPANGATVSGSIALSATAADNVGIVGVQFLVNGAATGAEDTSSPYSASWNSTTVANGSYSLAARARDAAGNQTTSTAITVTVNNTASDTTPPTVSMTAPANGATVSGSIALSATAADNVGIVGVQFLVNGAATGAEDTSSPYSVSWNSTTVANGSYSLAARARDAAGNQTTSTAITVTVNNTTAPPAAGLISAYSFNEGTGSILADVSGNNNNGAISNATWNASGRYGAALSFNGSTSRVDIAHSASLDLTTGLTMEAWVRPTTLNSWRAILIKEQTGDLVYGLYANTNNNRPSAHVFIGAKTDTRGIAKLPVNAWTHLAATYDGSVLRLYVNGAQVSTRTIGGNILTSTSPLRIGGDSFASEYFNGLIDEVRIYNRPLTATEIQTDMNTAIGTPPADTAPPTVSMTAPTAGAAVSGTVTLSANASDNVGVVGVQFLVNAAVTGAEDIAAPYSINWNTTGLANGSYTLSARARDAAGNQTTSTTITVTVNNTAPTDTTPPTVSITAAPRRAAVSGTVALTANAFDNIGVAGVQFVVNGIATGSEDTASPYSISWDTTALANGSYSLSARARDAAGNQTTSATITVTVNNTAPPPSPDWFPPTASARVPEPSLLICPATAITAQSTMPPGV